MGKLSTDNLKKLLGCIKKDSRVIVSPQAGFDSGVHRIGEEYLIVSTDPCTGVPEEWFGWLLIHYVASDIALFGAKMQFCTINLLGPPITKPSVFHKVMKQACNAADELEVAIVTGHTGTYESLSKLLGVCTGYGTVKRDKLITPSDAKPGDHILFVKPLGLETVVNLTLTNVELAGKLFGVQETNELVNLVSKQSCVKEANQLAQIKGVHAMHDATEGGLTAALNEMAEASNIGFKIEWEKIPVPQEVNRLGEFYHLTDEQLLSLSSTGSILAAVSPEAKIEVKNILHRNNVEANFLGVFTKDKRRILSINLKEKSFPKRTDDLYAKILSGRP